MIPSFPNRLTGPAPAGGGTGILLRRAGQGSRRGRTRSGSPCPVAKISLFIPAGLLYNKIWHRAGVPALFRVDSPWEPGRAGVAALRTARPVVAPYIHCIGGQSGRPHGAAPTKNPVRDSSLRGGPQARRGNPYSPGTRRIPTAPSGPRNDGSAGAVPALHGPHHP